MGKLFAYEWYKLGKRRLFLLLAGVLLAANIVAIYAQEQYTSAWFYIWEQRESFLRFQAGDTSADSDHYYQKAVDSQLEYLDSYGVFIGQMSDRAEQLNQSLLFDGNRVFLEGNLEKTQRDFAPFQGLELKVDNCFGVAGYAGYSTGILFLLVFLGVLAYYVLFVERDAGLLLLLKGCRRGHTGLGLGKLGTLLTGAAAYTVLQEGGTIGFYGIVYGYGDLARPVQSAQVFRNCALPLSVGEALAVNVLIRLAVALFLASVLYLGGMALRSKSGAVAMIGCVLGGLWGLNQVFTVNSQLNWLKCVNPFFCWDMEQTLGTYLNLNFFSHPVGKGVCAGVVGLIAGCGCAAMGVYLFHRTCQVRVKGSVELAADWLRGKMAWMSRHTNLLRFEGNKPLIQQKKVLVLLLLAAWCVWSCYGVYQPKYFGMAEDAAYEAYLQRWQGKITQETLDDIAEERERLNGIEAQMTQLLDSDQPDAAWTIKVLEAELDMWTDGLHRLEQQLEGLKARGADLFEVYLVNELAYIRIWRDVSGQVREWLLGTVMMLILVNGLYPMDEQRGLIALLRSTRNGQEKLDRSKNIVALLLSMAACLMSQLPLLVRYWEIDHFTVAGQDLSYLTPYMFRSGITLGGLLALVFLCKLAMFLLVGMGAVQLSKRMKHETLATVVTAGVAGVAAAVLIQIHCDVTVLICDLLTVPMW